MLTAVIIQINPVCVGVWILDMSADSTALDCVGFIPSRKGDCRTMVANSRLVSPSISVIVFGVY